MKASQDGALAAEAAEFILNMEDLREVVAFAAYVPRRCLRSSKSSGRTTHGLATRSTPLASSPGAANAEEHYATPLGQR